MLVTDKAASGVAPISVDTKTGTISPTHYTLTSHVHTSYNYVGENAIVVVPGANNHLTVEDIRNVETLIASASVVICQLEVPVATTLEALKLAKKHEGNFSQKYKAQHSSYNIITQ